MYKTFFGGKANKEILKIAKDDRQRVLEKLQKLDYPFPHSLDITKIADEADYFRLRVGKIRIIFLVNHPDKEIIVRKIKYRGAAYRH